MNAMHTRWQNQAGEADKEALHAALSLGTRIFTRGRSGGAVGWTQHCQFCWKASGGTRWMAERGSKAEASPGTGGSMKAGEDVRGEPNKRGSHERPRPASEWGGCQECCVGGLRLGGPWLKATPFHLLLPWLRKPCSPLGPELLLPCDRM